MDLTIITPQFTREDGQAVEYIPSTTLEYDKLITYDRDVLKHLGLRCWGRLENEQGEELPIVLWLFPHEWYPHIPENYPLTTISGRNFEFKPNVTDDDMRFGVLAYGITIPLSQKVCH